MTFWDGSHFEKPSLLRPTRNEARGEGILGGNIRLINKMLPGDFEDSGVFQDFWPKQQCLLKIPPGFWGGNSILLWASKKKNAPGFSAFFRESEKNT